MTRDAAIARFREATKNVKTSTSIALWTCLILSAALLVASFIVPPRGVIDPSVLKAASLIFAFAGLFFLREAVMEGLGVFNPKTGKIRNSTNAFYDLMDYYLLKAVKYGQKIYIEID